MTRSKFWLVISLLIVATMLVTACQPAAPQATPETIIQTVVVAGTPQVIVATAEPTEPPAVPAGPKVLHLNAGQSDPPTIDSALAWDMVSIQIVDELTVGLTRQNEQTTDMELAMATDYKVSEDGLTYTFTIRPDIPWVRYNGSEVEQVLDCDGNPRMVKAQDFAYGVNRTVNPENAADYAYVVAMIIQGAEPYSPDTIGAKAIDDTTLELSFINPAVYNLNVAGLWFMHAMPAWIIDGDDCTEGRGEKWIETGFYQGYGPLHTKRVGT
jgi:oligopeptide transport system substrate-binding protein